jgi:hypothetical protein
MIPLFPIPTGLRHSAQGCRAREATLGDVINFPQPQRGCVNRAFADGFNPFRVAQFSAVIPRVARASQPWAECRYPVGVNESRTLAALLPKLLSGELRVPAAAQLVEAAA